MPGYKIYFIEVDCINFFMEGKPHASKIEIYIIAKVRTMREKQGMTQIALSQAIGMADSFVSNVESVKRRDKCNINHLNLLAKVFGCSPKDFLP